MSDRILKSSWLVLFLLLVLLKFVIVIIFFLKVVPTHLLYSRSEESIFPDERHERNFRYMRIDLNSNNRAYLGRISSYKPLPFVQESISESIFIESNDHHSLISKYEGKEFLCIGTCTCKEQENEEYLEDYSARRHVSNTLSKGFIFLVSALTSIVAFDLASEYFSQKCNEHFEQSCASSEIHSEVEDCENIFSEGEGWEDEDTLENEPEETEYICSGRCNEKDFFEYVLGEDGNYQMEEFYRKTVGSIASEEEYLWSWIIENEYDRYGGFEYYDRKEVVKESFLDLIESFKSTVSCHEMSITSTVRVERVGSFEHQETMAASKFKNVNLHKVCRSQGMLDLDSEKTMSKIREGVTVQTRKRYQYSSLSEESNLKVVGVILDKMPKFVWKMCVGEIHLQDEFDNLNIVCRRQFTEEEWEKGIPYKNNNLRHWKEGYMLNK